VLSGVAAAKEWRTAATEAGTDLVSAAKSANSSKTRTLDPGTDGGEEAALAMLGSLAALGSAQRSKWAAELRREEKGLMQVIMASQAALAGSAKEQDQQTLQLLQTQESARVQRISRALDTRGVFDFHLQRIESLRASASAGPH
jgi:hypothetical protein